MRKKKELTFYYQPLSTSSNVSNFIQTNPTQWMEDGDTRNSKQVVISLKTLSKKQRKSLHNQTQAMIYVCIRQKISKKSTCLAMLQAFSEELRIS